jgi:hypothetical protein
MNNQNEAEKDKRISSLLSAVERGTTQPDKRFLGNLRSESAEEFSAHSADRNRQLRKTIPISRWTMIMKNRMTSAAAAAAIIGVFGLYLFFGTDQAILFAQVMEAFEKAKTIYAIGYSFQDGQKKKAHELWYQQGLGLRVEEISHGRIRTRLDDGQHEWEYTEGNEFAVQMESKRKMRLPGEITEPSRYLKQCTRDPDGDIEIDGSACSLYVHTHPGNGNKPAIRSMMWIDDQMRFRRYEEQKFTDGLWRKIESATISYDVPIEPRLFAADFGPNVDILKPEDPIRSLFPLESAIATKQVMGLVFAVHQLKRSGDYIFTTCSIRPTEDTRRSCAPEDRLYAHFDLTSWWQRKEHGHLEQHPYAHTTLARCHVDDVSVGSFASLPKAQWPGVDKELELSVHISPTRRLRDFLQERGQAARSTAFRPLLTLTLPAEDTPVAGIAASLYGTARLAATLGPMLLEPSPSDISGEEFADEVKLKLIGLRPMAELWQSVGSEITVRLLDEDGRPVVGARIGSDIRSHDGRLYWHYQNKRRDCAVSDADGNVVLKGQQMFDPEASRQNSCMLYAVQEENKLAGVLPISDDDFGKAVTLEMRPACRVFGRFVCPELSDKGDTPGNSVNTHLSLFGETMVYRVLYHTTDKQQFEALLAPGKYELSSQCYYRDERRFARAAQLVDVPRNKQELDLGMIVLKLEDHK